MNKQELYNNMVEHLKENTDTISEIVSNCNSWDGSLEDYYYWENDEEFFNINFEGCPLDAVRACYYGDYKYCDAYVHFNAYGNLDSIEDYELEDILKDNVEEILDRFIELVEQNKLQVDHIYGDDTFKLYLNKYLKAEEEETTEDEQ